MPAAEFQKWSGFDAVADREGFVVVYPEAINREWSYGRVTNQPMPVVDGQTVDDVGFIRLLIDELVAGGLADAGRVSAAGSSRGGLLAYTLACCPTGLPRRPRSSPA